MDSFVSFASTMVGFCTIQIHSFFGYHLPWFRQRQANLPQHQLDNQLDVRMMIIDCSIHLECLPMIKTFNLFVPLFLFVTC